MATQNIYIFRLYFHMNMAFSGEWIVQQQRRIYNYLLQEKMCQEHGLYTAVAGLMLANKSPVSAWNPVRGPKNMKVQYP